MVKAIPCFNGPTRDKRRPHGHRRAPFFCAEGRPGPTQYRAQRRACNEPPSGPCCSPASWRAGASAARHPRRKIIGCQTCQMVRKWASARWGAVRNAGGWGVAGGCFALTLKVRLMIVLRGEQACARAKPPPPSSARGASQSTRKSTLRTGHGHSEGQ